jgi:F-type H+-transporting ATPase subunit b
MELVKPDYGLVFWMVLSFSLLVFILTRFAWKPILKALKQREQSIEDALRLAEKTREEMARLKADNEQLMAEARNQRDQILKEAREAKERIINEARQRATQEAERLLKIARESIHNEKMAAITELKNQVAVLSIEIAEKIIRQHLSADEQQRALIAEMLKDVKPEELIVR